MATLTGKIQTKRASKYDVCACGDVKSKVSKTCQKCFFLRMNVNPKTIDGKYTHKKGNCIDCGKQISDVYRVYCRSCSHKGKSRPNISGEKHSNWKGGITPINLKIRGSIEGKMWIHKVLLRDGFICQKTGQKGGQLSVHHILNFAEYPELRFEVDNGITLSMKAHLDFHKKYGFKNNTIEQLSEFLSNNK